MWVHVFDVYLSLIVGLRYVGIELEFKFIVKNQSIWRSSILEVTELVSFTDVLTLFYSRVATWDLVHTDLYHAYQSTRTIIDLNDDDLPDWYHRKQRHRFDIVFKAQVLVSKFNLRVYHEVLVSYFIWFYDCTWNRSVPSVIAPRIKVSLVHRSTNKMVINELFQVSFFSSEHLVKRIVIVLQPKVIFSLNVRCRIPSQRVIFEVNRTRIWTMDDCVGL